MVVACIVVVSVAQAELEMTAEIVAVVLVECSLYIEHSRVVHSCVVGAVAVVAVAAVGC